MIDSRGLVGSTYAEVKVQSGESVVAMDVTKVVTMGWCTGGVVVVGPMVVVRLLEYTMFSYAAPFPGGKEVQ